MELPGTLSERASTALQRLKKLPNLVCLSTLAGLAPSRHYATAQAFVDQCATKHRHKAREAVLAALGSAGASHCSQRQVSLHSASCNTQAYAIAASVTSRLARCTTQ